MRLPLAAGLVLVLSAPAPAALFYPRQLTATTGEIVAYDTETNTALRTYAVAIPDIDGLARDPLSENLFVASSNGGGVFRLNLVSGVVSPLPLQVGGPFNPSALVFGGGQDLFVANQTAPGPAAVLRVDLQSDPPAGTVEDVLTAGGVLRAPAGLAVDPTTGDLFVTSLGPNVPSQVVRLSSSTGAVLQTYTGPLFQNPIGLAVDPGGVDLFVGNSGGANVLRVNIATGAATVFASGLARPQGVAFGPDGNLYVATVTQQIAVLDGTTGFRVGTIPTGPGNPEYLAFGDLPPGAVPAAAVPEPASLATAGVGGLTLLAARRRRGRATGAAGRSRPSSPGPSAPSSRTASG